MRAHPCSRATCPRCAIGSLAAVRVVGGVARGRRIQAPAGRGTRPTGDRVREAVFDMLASMGGLDGAVVADLFAGSGALGIEALSRGAARATFVEADRRAVDTLVANLAAVGDLAGRAEVVRSEVLAWLGPGPALEQEPPRAFDVALCDPPYGFGRWAELLARIRAGTVVVESDRPVEPGPAWRVLRCRSYGGTVVTLARPMEVAQGGTA